MLNNEALHILMADDDENDRIFFRQALEEIKTKTVLTFVSDGIQLMKHLNAPEIKLPQLVFLDLNMPYKNGMDCLREIRKNSTLKDLIIVIYSAVNSEDKVEEAFIHGANIFIQKPSNFNSMKSCLTQVINLNWQYHTLGLNKENFILKV